jgi:MFS transporter, PPP family, 3-phenylpropionic acid transporter
MAALPHRPLAGFYFFYFAYLGAFAPFFSVYLEAAGLTPFEIGVVMALPSVTRIIAPGLWGWLADAGGGRMRVVRATTLAGAVCWLGMFGGGGFPWICAVVFALCFFFSAALPLMEAATLTHIGEHTGRYGNIRLWGSVGYIAAVVLVGYALDLFPVGAVVWIVLACILGTLAFTCLAPEAKAQHHASDDQPIAGIFRRPEAIALIGAGALMAVAHGPYYTFYSLHLVDHGYSKALAGWLWALGVVCEIGIFLWLPRLYSMFDLRAILIASFALAVARFLIIGWGAQHFALLLFAQVLHAATFGSFHAAAIGIVHRLFRGRHQARGQAIYGSLSYGVGGTAGALASGYAWGELGAALTFTLASAAALAGMLLLVWKLRLRP